MNMASQIRTALVLREAEAEAARLDSLLQGVEKHEAERKVQESSLMRDTALGVWHNALRQRLSEPAFMGAASRWLLSCESILVEDGLDLKIAEQRYQRAVDAAAVAQARVLATRDKSDEICRQDLKRLEERALGDLLDILCARQKR